MSDRYDFFFRQKVTEQELDDAFAALEAADRNLAIDTGLIGVLQNAVVTEKAGTPDLTVDISGSAALHDKLGQRVAWGPVQNIDVSVDENSQSTEPPVGQELIVGVYAKFTRTLTDPRVDGNSVTVFFDQAESFEFVVRQGAATAAPPATPPALDVEYVLIADIQRTNGQTQVLNANITPPGGAYTAISNRREAAFVLAAGSLSVLAGTPEESDQAVLTELNNHITGVGNAHAAAAIDYAGGNNWVNGNTNPAATVEAQLDKLIFNLAGTASPSSGSDHIGAGALAGSPDSVGASGLIIQLTALLTAINARGRIASAETITGDWDFTKTIDLNPTGGGADAALTDARTDSYNLLWSMPAGGGESLRLYYGGSGAAHRGFIFTKNMLWNGGADNFNYDVGVGGTAIILDLNLTKFYVKFYIAAAPVNLSSGFRDELQLGVPSTGSTILGNDGVVENDKAIDVYFAIYGVAAGVGDIMGDGITFPKKFSAAPSSFTWTTHVAVNMNTADPTQSNVQAYGAAAFVNSTAAGSVQCNASANIS